jgi:hypothetical protein
VGVATEVMQLIPDKVQCPLQVVDEFQSIE